MLPYELLSIVWLPRPNQDGHRVLYRDRIVGPTHVFLGDPHPFPDPWADPRSRSMGVFDPIIGGSTFWILSRVWVRATTNNDRSSHCWRARRLFRRTPGPGTSWRSSWRRTAPQSGGRVPSLKGRGVGLPFPV